MPIGYDFQSHGIAPRTEMLNTLLRLYLGGNTQALDQAIKMNEPMPTNSVAPSPEVASQMLSWLPSGMDKSFASADDGRGAYSNIRGTAERNNLIRLLQEDDKRKGK